MTNHSIMYNGCVGPDAERAHPADGAAPQPRGEQAAHHPRHGRRPGAGVRHLRCAVLVLRLHGVTRGDTPDGSEQPMLTLTARSSQYQLCHFDDTYYLKT